jgi:hypothetical protein
MWYEENLVQEEYDDAQSFGGCRCAVDIGGLNEPT